MSGAEEVSRRKSEIIERLKSIRRIQTPKKRVHELVEFLEGKQSLDQKFNFQDMTVDTYKPNQIRYREFCQAYMVALFKRFIPDDDDIEIMLVAYNWHPKYMHIKERIERKDTFARETYEPKHPEKDWGPKPTDKDRGLREEEDRIIGELAGVLAIIVDKNDGTLDFTETVLRMMKSETQLPPVEPQPVEPSSTEPHPVEPSSLKPSSVEPSPSNRRSNKILCYIVAVGVILIISLQILAANNGYARLELGLFRAVLDFRSDYVRPTPIEQTEPASVNGNHVENSSKVVDGYILEHENEQEDDFNEKP